MLIYISTLRGDTLTFEIDPSETISSLKEKLYKKEGVIPERQRIIYSGIQMQDDKSIDYYHLCNKTTLHFVTLNEKKYWDAIIESKVKEALGGAVGGVDNKSTNRTAMMSEFQMNEILSKIKELRNEENAELIAKLNSISIKQKEAFTESESQIETYAKKIRKLQKSKLKLIDDKSNLLEQLNEFSFKLEEMIKDKEELLDQNNKLITKLEKVLEEKEILVTKLNRKPTRKIKEYFG